MPSYICLRWAGSSQRKLSLQGKKKCAEDQIFRIPGSFPDSAHYLAKGEKILFFFFIMELAKEEVKD